ncbi:transcription factor bHLH96-like [Punica granatum]|uniref:Transcription factor bHLH96-like n=2 Tax=Punica granatum TaxID=22663 RepID=A0A6P8DNQ1_PUNGR|nr:transcription factor bHLH96-like [Punica granatum]
MALETVVFKQDPFSSSSSSYLYEEHFYPCGGSVFEPDYDMTGIQTPEKSDNDVAILEKSVAGVSSWDSGPMVGCDGGINSSSSSSLPPEDFGGGSMMFPAMDVAVGCRRKIRRKARVVKNKEEVENQRTAHIAVERNRRKQMNEYLAVLRSMMPPSYTHRVDQASIIEGAVNFVKELEQLLQSLKAAQRKVSGNKNTTNDLSSSPFADFFTFPQYSADPTQLNHYAGPTVETMVGPERPETAIANVEVTMADNHANVKVLSTKQPKQLLKMVVRLQYLGVSILHLNVTTVNDMVLYSFSTRVEDNCQFTSANEIAAAVYEMVVRIQEEANFS